MRFLGIDYGEKRIGLATSDEDGRLAFPREVLPNDKKIFEKLQEVISKENISEIVIGESLDFAGKLNPIAPAVEGFVGELGEKFKLPIHKEKEFLTSVEARRYQGGNKVDASAAALILQRYLDRKR